jgi:hypothetical protein
MSRYINTNEEYYESEGVIYKNKFHDVCILYILPVSK